MKDRKFTIKLMDVEEVMLKFTYLFYKQFRIAALSHLVIPLA